jgi:hypothetical protein
MRLCAEVPSQLSAKPIGKAPMLESESCRLAH